MEHKVIEKAKSCFYSKEQPYAWFYSRIVREQQLFPLCGQDIPSIMIPGDFFVICTVKIPVEEIIAVLEDCAFDEVAQRAYSQEKERPWGLRTYRPFRWQLQDAKPSFKEMLRIAKEIIDEIGMPMSSKYRGRRR
jgi:hypothetical protein